jgi:hypothetical protein
MQGGSVTRLVAGARAPRPESPGAKFHPRNRPPVVEGGVPSTHGAARYSAGTVTAVPGAPLAVQRLLGLYDGSVVVHGAGLRRWDGTTWTVLPSSPGLALGQLPTGELLAGGIAQAVGGAPASALYRLRSTGWESFGAVDATATAVVASGHGDVFAAGSMSTASGQVSAGFVHGEPTCPAAVAVAGSGCSGGAGPVTLQAAQGAWVGGTFRAAATGMTASSLALQLVGVQGTVQPLPGGAPGCSLFLLPVFADVLVPAFGVATTAWPVPAQPILAGQQLLFQVVGIELGAGGGIVRLTSTNALQLTVGAL